MSKASQEAAKANNKKKYIVGGIIIALLLISFSGHRGGKKRARSGSKKRLQCQEKYNKTTICNYDDHPRARMMTVTPNDKDLIVKLHNHFRSQAEPSASNMQKLIWDDRLARFAQKWARVCKYGRDKPKERMNPEYRIPVGQNVAYGYRDWSSVVQLWFGDVEQVYNKADKFNQILWVKQLRDKTARIGCGVSYCPEFRRAYVCNYAYGNFAGLSRLYKQGSHCSDCPNFCDENLCDCKGKICLNGGSLNLATCKCKCPKIYGGAMCSKLRCPKKDKRRCGMVGPKGYQKESCKKIAKVQMECPYMCGICTYHDSVPKVIQIPQKSTKKKSTKKGKTEGKPAMKKQKKQTGKGKPQAKFTKKPTGKPKKSFRDDL